MSWYMYVLRNYDDFRGRARRKEYWMFTLVNIVFSAIVGFTFGALSVVLRLPLLAVLAYFYTFFTFLPSVAVAVRRMHDVNFRGWWFLFPFVNFVLLVWPGTEGPNRFGPDPKAQIEMPSPNQ